MLFNYNENSLKSGVYQIRNLINGKVYIGSAKRFKERGKDHLRSLERGKHHNKHLQASWNKYGTDNFVFEVIEVVNKNKKERQACEQKYIDSYLKNWEQCYNISKKSILNEPWTKTTNETIKQNTLVNGVEKYKQTCLHKYGVEHPNQLLCNKNKLRNLVSFNKNFLQYQFQPGHDTWIKGKTHSLETRKKLSKSNCFPEGPFKGKKHSQKTKEKISKAKIGQALGMKHPRAKVYEDINLVSPHGTLYTKIECLHEFCRVHNLTPTKLCAVINGRRKSHRNWRLATLAAFIL